MQQRPPTIPTSGPECGSPPPNDSFDLFQLPVRAIRAAAAPLEAFA